MLISRRNLIATGAAALAAPAIVRAPASAQSALTLKLHHFLPAVSNVHQRLLAPWTRKVEAASGGKLKIDIYPAMQLGGAPPQLYDQARDGVVDIVWTVTGFTPGRFPSTEVFELPFVANRLGVVNAKACQDYAQTHLREETKETKLLCFWAHDHGLIHSLKPIKTLEDFKGTKIRFPTRYVGEALRALGANAVGIPTPQVPESLAQRVIDGAVVPWEVVPALKLQELVKYHTEIPGSPTLYTACMMLAMNKAKYESLPSESRQVIDENSGMAFAAAAGKMWDEVGLEVRDMVNKRGNVITVITEDERSRWVKATQPVIDSWIGSMKDKNIDGRKLLETAKATLAKYSGA